MSGNPNSVGNLRVQFVASQKTKIFLIFLVENFFLEVFSFKGMIDFNMELIKWKWNKNCLKVDGRLFKQRYIFTTDIQFVPVEPNEDFYPSL